MELAEAQIKLVEMENSGGGRHQELEKELLEARMSNARLMEDNESYQLLLSEKTLNGDFSKADLMHESHQDSQPTPNSVGSLADELESVGEGGDADSRRRMEGEIKSLKDQNKALTLYIERIIGRLLQTEGFEHILDKNESEPPPKRMSSGSAPEAHKSSDTNKELPPAPQDKNDSSGPSFLQRARSVVSGQSNRPRPRPRPMSQMTQSSLPDTSEAHPTAHENPNTAPSIPLGRSRTVHRRTRSEMTDVTAAAAVVGQMYRGPSGPMSPGISPTLSQAPMFPSSGRTSGRVTSMSSRGERLSSRGSVTSDRSGEVASTEGTSSPPRSSPGMNNYTGAVMTQNKLRPLRLVQENKEMESGDQGGRPSEEEEAAARKKANRGSWIPWINRPKESESVNDSPAS